MREVVPPILTAEQIAALGTDRFPESEVDRLAASHEALRADRDALDEAYGQMQEWYTAYRRKAEAERDALRQALTDLMDTIHFFDRGDEYRRARAVLAGDQ